MAEALVSVIVPCFNMGSKIFRLFDSLLVQTYKNLHIIVVDDGSTDNSKVVINNYSTSFKKRGMVLEYVYKENGGLGSAINKGLKHVKGDYFCWPDPDDWLSEDSIEKRVRFLENHKEYAFVRSDAKMYYEGNLEEDAGTFSKKLPNRFKTTNLFEDYILERGVIFCPGCHMVRTSSFRNINPQMEIFEGQMGQNYQMLLPLLYHYKFGYIDECLYNYIAYNDSMSHSQEWYDRANHHHEEIILQTLKRIDMSDDERKYYSELTKQKYIIRRCVSEFRRGNRSLFKEYFKKLNEDYFCCFDSLIINKIQFIKKISNIPVIFYIANWLSTYKK